MKFADAIETYPVVPYSVTHKLHPNTFLFAGPIGSNAFVRVPHGHDPHTGVTIHELQHRKEQFLLRDTNERTKKLRFYRVEGSAWEEHVSDIIAKLSKSKKFKQRLGARTAKDVERLRDPRKISSEEEATDFRALAARANYLALDRPDVAFATK